jgi:HSP20 family protein
MRLTRFEPFRVADFLQHNVDSTAARQQLWQPAADVVEFTDAFVVQLDLPGVAAADIEISTDRGVLSISGERRLAELDETATLTRRERRNGRFERRFALPDTSDIDNIRAQSRDGILEVRIPKRAEVQPRKIVVEAA